MTRAEAINILDMRRAGRDMAFEVVNEALQATGDLEFAKPAVLKNIHAFNVFDWRKKSSVFVGLVN